MKKCNSDLLYAKIKSITLEEFYVVMVSLIFESQFTVLFPDFNPDTN